MSWGRCSCAMCERPRASCAGWAYEFVCRGVRWAGCGRSPTAATSAASRPRAPPPSRLPTAAPPTAHPASEGHREQQDFALQQTLTSKQTISFAVLLGCE